MKYIDWDKKKNQKLQEERGVSFEDVVTIIEEGDVVDRISHPNQIKYPHQHMLVVDINNYIYLIPYVEDEEKLFLKTIIPSRKLTKIYLIKEKK